SAIAWRRASWPAGKESSTTTRRATGRPREESSWASRVSMARRTSSATSSYRGTLGYQPGEVFGGRLKSTTEQSSCCRLGMRRSAGSRDPSRPNRAVSLDDHPSMKPLLAVACLLGCVAGAFAEDPAEPPLRPRFRPDVDDLLATEPAPEKLPPTKIQP